MFKRRLTILAVAAALFLGIAAPASAQNQQDGLVNVAIYDVTVTDLIDVIVTDVDIGVAAQVAANLCGLKVGPVAVLGTAVDRSGDTRTVCTTGGQAIVLEQN